VSTAAELEIHGYLTCPFAWRVRLAAAEKRVPADFLPCDIDHPDPRSRAHNPDEHSPLLYHAGLTLTESAVIIDYIDEAFAGSGPALMPPDARGRALLRLLAKQLEGLDVHTERARPEARRKSERALGRLESELHDRGTPFLHGAEPGRTDVMIWPFLADLHLRRLLDAASYPAATAYVDRARARPSFQTTRPPWASGL
jgi:glutathione S-transferase